MTCLSTAPYLPLYCACPLARGNGTNDLISHVNKITTYMRIMSVGVRVVTGAELENLKSGTSMSVNELEHGKITLVAAVESLRG